MKKLPLLKKLTLQYAAKGAKGYGDLSAESGAVFSSESCCNHVKRC